MKLYRTNKDIILQHGDGFYTIENIDWDALVNRDDLFSFLTQWISENPGYAEGEHVKGQWRAPILRQEIWAAGVTYLRSREARMEESKDSGAADFYAKVYDAERPELFFKSTAERCSGPDGIVHIRRDSQWNVPEPELTLFATSSGKIVGYTIGNDMSSRDIEGENPLYLPQAKSYDFSAAIGPCLYVPASPICPDTPIIMQIERAGSVVFEGQITIDRMKRKHQELVDFLFREMSFPHGVYLMTGTCLVPTSDFTLKVGDIISIEITPIGILKNTVGIKI
jgi:2-dehydro-3-deoxy-D-arabinonate dehydratase